MNQTPNPNEAEPTWISYLLELRKRLLRFAIGLLCLFGLCAFYSNTLYHHLAAPLLAHLPEHSQLIATNITSVFITPIKLSFYVALFLSVPLLLFEVWGFIAPALYTHEKKLLIPLIVLSLVLFACGMAFAYAVVFPLMFKFFVGSAPTHVKLMPDISHYLDLTMQLFFAFGLAFEVPIAVFLVLLTGVTTPQKLAGGRPYVIVGAFVLGMFLTPPDVISQVLLALPLWFLFELGLLLGRFLPKPRPQSA